MKIGISMALGFLAAASVIIACCPAPPPGKVAVNADQTVIILWDPVSKTQHFIRQANFRTEADDFGFLVPTPTQPELAEAGDAAFPYLAEITKPQIVKLPRPISIGCATQSPQAGSALWSVRVLEEKRVAGFNAAVLQADGADELSGWLKDHGYAITPELEAWVKPYVDQRWVVTAFKVAKDRDQKAASGVKAAAVRLSFRTDRPLFPYREPDYKGTPAALGLTKRTLRIFFLAEGRYRGELTRDERWTGAVVWSGKIRAKQRQQVLDHLQVPEAKVAGQLWLTEFEDNWDLRRPAPADVYFQRDRDQSPHKRSAIIQYVSAPWPTDVTAYALAAVVVLPPVIRRCRRRRS